MGCRKVTMTIQQLLTFEKGNAIYKLPLNIKDDIDELKVNIKVNLAIQKRSKQKLNPKNLSTPMRADSGT